MDLYLPFNSMNRDRVHTAEDIADMFAAVMTDGVHPNPGDSLFVEAAGGWDLNIRPGRCVIKGRLGQNYSVKTLTVDPPNGALNRIDAVVLRCDYSRRLIEEYIRKGTSTQTPVAPALQRDADAYELCLAQVYVGASATKIQQSNITDTRQNSALCGVINSLIKVDPDSLFAQYKAAFEEWAQRYRDARDEWADGVESDIQAFLNNLKVMTEEGENRVIADVAKLYWLKADRNLQFFNVELPVSLWVPDTTYATHSYRADIPLTHVTEDMIPRVVFDVPEAMGGGIANIARAMDGHVRIYARSKPTADIVIPTIVCEPMTGFNIALDSGAESSIETVRLLEQHAADASTHTNIVLDGNQ